MYFKAASVMLELLMTDELQALNLLRKSLLVKETKGLLSSYKSSSFVLSKPTALAVVEQIAFELLSGSWDSYHSLDRKVI